MAVATMIMEAWEGWNDKRFCDYVVVVEAGDWWLRWELDQDKRVWGITEECDPDGGDGLDVFGDPIEDDDDHEDDGWL